MIQKGPKKASKWGQAPKRARNDAKPMPKCSLCDPKVTRIDPKMIQNDAKMTPKWSYFGPKIVQVTPKMAQKASKDGQK